MQSITYLNQETSQNFDVELMSEEVGFTLDILMELAGQGIANTVQLLQEEGLKLNKVIVLCGPGNNGGDGLVSARQLKMMGFQVDIALFRQVTNPFFKRLINTCIFNDIPIRYDLIGLTQEKLVGDLSQYDFIVDALLGFSYKPPLREPYESVIKSLSSVKPPILAVDIPSGWNVESGNVEQLFTPQYILSLTLPKLGVKEFKGRHFLGGRFIPLRLKEKYNMILPNYKGSNVIQEITHLQ